MSNQGRRLRVYRPGKLGRLVLENFDLAEPGPGEVRIRCERIGVNFADLFVVWGLYRAAPPPPVGPGFEVAGVVEACGPGVARFRPGDRVMALCHFGGYTSHLVTPADVVFPVPAGWSTAEAAGFLVAGMTAWHGLFVLGRLARGERVVVTSAAGGVGQVAVKIAAAAGARVAGLVGSAAKEKLVLDAGAEEVLRYKEPDFPRRLDAALGGSGFDVFFDAVGGRVSRLGYDRLRPMGRLVTYGLSSMTPSGGAPNWLRLAWQFLFERFTVSPFHMIQENRTVAGFNLAFLWSERGRAQEYVDALFKIDAARPLKPLVSREWPLEQVDEAHRHLQSGSSVGKLLLSVS